MPRSLVRPLALLALAACAGTPARETGPAAPAARDAGAVDASLGDTAAAAPDASAAATPPLTDTMLCAMTPAVVAPPRPGAVVFAFQNAHCKANQDPFCNTVNEPPDPKDTCFVATTNISRAERDMRAARATSGAASPASDGTTPPKYLDRIDAHLHLSAREHGMLRQNGFVVLDRLPYADYANAFHDVFQEQLPLYVGVDPILHAVFRGTELALERVEREKLVPALTSLLKKLRAGLSAAGRYDAETRKDLDLYLGVAQALWGTDHFVPRKSAYEAGTGPKPSVLGQDDAIAALAAKAQGGGLEEVEMFGRPRMVDFSQLTPRGHYANARYPLEDLSPYFRAVMWLSRLEYNLVSRSCRSSQPGDAPNPEETPREAKDAMALADLVERTGASVELRLFDDLYTGFAGRREDVSPAELSRVMHANGVAWNDFAKLKSAIGEKYKRTARTHFMPQGAVELPAISTMFGPRIVPDVAPLTRLVHDKLRGRMSLGAADVAYVLGHDRARKYLASDLAAFPILDAALDGARQELIANAQKGTDVYASWLRSVTALGATPRGAVPSFMKKDAYADAKMGSALVGFGQIRHTFVLLAAQGYDAYGCEIPDAYVEPLPAVFDALLAHVRNMRAHAKGWAGLEHTLAMLAEIARAEAAGLALTEPQRRWLGMVAEHIPLGGGDTGEPPKWTGWWFDMFEDRQHGASASTSFVADYFTLTNDNKVKYLGAEGPRLGVFVVDVGGEPRAMVGPVAKGYEVDGPIASRLDDEHAVAQAGKTARWRDSFAAPELPDPAVAVEGRTARCEKDGQVEWRAAVRSARAVGPVIVTLLDHHADAFTTPAKIDVGPTWSVVAFTTGARPASKTPIAPGERWTTDGPEAIHVHIDDLSRANAGAGAWDYFTSPSVFRGEGQGVQGLPARPRGIRDFGIGVPPPPGSPRP